MVTKAGRKTNVEAAPPRAAELRVARDPREDAVNYVRYQAALMRFGDRVEAPHNREELEEVLGKTRLGSLIASSRDAAVQELVTNPTAKVTPRQLFKPWEVRANGGAAADSVAVGQARGEVDVAPIADAVKSGQEILAELRAAPPSYSFGGQLVNPVDTVAKVAEYSTDVLLARELAKHPAIGGSDVLAQALDHLDLPRSVAGQIQTQLPTLPKVESKAAASGKLASKELSDTDLVNVVTEPGGHAVNVEHFVSGSAKLAEIMGRLANADTKGQIWPLLQRVLAAPHLSRAVKKAALDGAKDAVRRAAERAERAKRDAAELRAKDPNVAVQEPAMPRISNLFTTMAAEAPNLLPLAFDALAGSPADQAQVLAASADPVTWLVATPLSVDDRSTLLAQRARLENQTPPLLAALLPEPARGERLRALIGALGWANIPPHVRIAFDPATLQAAASALRNDASSLPGSQDLVRLAGEGAALRDLVHALVSQSSPHPTPAGADAALDEDLKRVASQGMEGAGLLSRSFLGRGKLLERIKGSTAIGLIPIQLENRLLANPAVDVPTRLVGAVAEYNGAIFEVVTKLSASHPDLVPWEGLVNALATAVPGAKPGSDQEKFCTGLLMVLAAKLGEDHPTVVRVAQEIFARSNSIALLPYAGLTPEQNLERLLAALREPDLPLHLGRVDLPAGGMQAIATAVAADDGVSTSARIEVLLRALGAGVMKDTVLRLAGQVCNGYVETLLVGRALVDAGYTVEDGAKLVESLPAKSDLTPVALALAELASKNQLVKADDVAGVALRSPEGGAAATHILHWALDPKSWYASVSPDRQFDLLTRAFTAPGTVLASRAAELARATKALQDRGAKYDISLPLNVVLHAVAVAGAQPLSQPNLGQVISDAQRAGVSVEAIIGAVADPAQHKPFSGLMWNGKPADNMMAMLLHVMRVSGSIDSERVKAVIEWKYQKPEFAPYQEAFTTAGTASEANREALLRAAAKWAWGAGRFDAVTQAYEAYERAGNTGVTATFDNVLSELVKEDPQWAKHPLARAQALKQTVAELTPAVDKLISAGAQAQGIAKNIAERVNALGEVAPDVANALLEHARRLVAADRPTLAEIELAFGVPKIGKASDEQKRADAAGGETIDFLGFELPVFSGERLAPVPKQREMQPIPTWVKNLQQIVQKAFIDDRPTIVLGDPAAAKTSGVTHISALTKTPLFRINGQSDASVSQIFGRWMTDKHGRPFFEEGPFIKLWVKGGNILIDEYDGFPKDIKDLLGEFVRGYHNEIVLSIGKRTVRLQRNPQTRLIFTGNYRNNPIPDDLRRCSYVYADAIPPGELTDLLVKQFPSAPPEALAKAAEFQDKFNIVAAEIGNRNYQPTLRDALRAAERFDRYNGRSEKSPLEVMAQVCREIYLDDLRGLTTAEREKLFKGAFQPVFGCMPDATEPTRDAYSLVYSGTTVSMGDVTVPCGPNEIPPLDKLTINEGLQIPIVWTPELERAVYLIWKARECRQPLLLSGDGATTALRVADALSGWPSTIKDCNLVATAEHVLNNTTIAANESGQMTTIDVDGYLTEIARKGGPFSFRHFDNLDPMLALRLHDVFEDSREYNLLNNETVQMHPNFFLAATLGNGSEPSSAFLNRVVAVALPPQTEQYRAAVLAGTAARWDLPEIMGQLITRFESGWVELRDKRILSPHHDRVNLLEPSLDRGQRWLHDMKKAHEKAQGIADTDERQAYIQERFVAGALAHYSVPDTASRERLTNLASALARGDEAAIAEALK